MKWWGPLRPRDLDLVVLADRAEALAVELGAHVHVHVVDAVPLVVLVRRVRHDRDRLPGRATARPLLERHRVAEERALTAHEPQLARHPQRVVVHAEQPHLLHAEHLRRAGRGLSCRVP